MGRGGGHSSGGRSSGGGGRSSARSSGGRSRGASRGGYSGGLRGGHSRPGAGSRRVVYGGMPRPPRYHAGRRASYSRGPSAGGLGSVFVPLALFFIVFIALIIFALASSSQGVGNVASKIARSTVKREKLISQYVTTMGWYTDELGWIESGAKLTAGMRTFYDKTGVAPYLYITDTVNGTTSPSDEDMEIYANKLYDELFSDEAHILLLFYEHNEDSNYKTRYVCGAAAKTVMDDEACGILLDYVDAYYFSNLEDDEMFSAAFEKAASRIMSVTRSPVPYIILALIALAIVVVAFAWWRRGVEQRNREAEERERILNADIGSVEDPKLKDLEEKYKNPK